MDLDLFGEGLAQPGDREAGCLCGVDDYLLAASEQCHCSRQTLDRLDRDNDGAVAVGMDHVIWRHDHPGDADGSAEIDEMDMGMRGHDRPGKDQEIRRHCIEIAHRAVGDDASAAEPFMDIALHFTPECAEAFVGDTAAIDYHTVPQRRRGVAAP